MENFIFYVVTPLDMFKVKNPMYDVWKLSIDLSAMYLYMNWIHENTTGVFKILSNI